MYHTDGPRVENPGFRATVQFFSHSASNYIYLKTGEINVVLLLEL
jgi:hypothetical protein